METDPSVARAGDLNANILKRMIMISDDTGLRLVGQLMAVEHRPAHHGPIPDTTVTMTVLGQEITLDVPHDAKVQAVAASPAQ